MKALLLLLSAWLASPAHAQGLVDCPLRDAAYSTQSPLYDVLINPTARAVVERDQPDLFKHIPPALLGPQIPSFATIMTLRQAAEFFGVPGAAIATIDRDLAAIPVTRADRIARCARYDTAPPRLAFAAGRPRLLLFEKINGFRDSPSVVAAHAAFVDIAARKGWTLVTTDRGSAFAPAILRRFDAVIWNNVSGDVLTLSQRRAFQAYIGHGGGFVGVHGSAGDPVYFWPWYADDLIGARFAGHPLAKQFQTAHVTLAADAGPIAAGLPASWDMTEEWYSFTTNPRATGAHVIATLDEASYDPDGGPAGVNLRMGDHPLVWTRCVGAGSDRHGAGRMFYSAIGHRPEHYANPVYVRLLEQAIAWAAGRDRRACGAGR